MYQALYRKYRSLTFDEVVGQESVTRTLKSQVSAGKLSHAYLFTGIRGTGKTSCAKILSRAVNCENPIDGNPCNSCASCRSILEGSCLDVLEIDAASNNGVDNVRTLRDDAIYSPSEVRKRVYIIDEVHMLSTAAFNALLKIIEEPPEHLIFILATTESDRVPATILSRCQRYNFKRLSNTDIAGRLSYVAYHEGIDLESDAAALLARLADGALRDGLSLLDQCASATKGTVTPDAVYNCLGLAGVRATNQMLTMIANRDTNGVLSLFTELYEQGKDVRALLTELGNAARDILLMKASPEGQLPMLSGLCAESEIKQLTGKFSGGELLRMTELLQELLAGRVKTVNLRIDAELCLIRLCNPALQNDVSSFNARLNRIEEQLASGVAVTAAEPAAEHLNAMEKVSDKSAPVSEHEKAPENSGREETPTGFRTELFRLLYDEFGYPIKAQFAANSTVKFNLSGDTLTMVVDTFQKDMLSKPEILQIISRKASTLLKRPVRAAVQLSGGFGSNEDPMEALLAKKSLLGDKMTVR